MYGNQLSLPRMAEIIYMVILGAGLGRGFMEHSIQLSKYSSAMGDLSSQESFLLLQGLQKIPLGVSKTLLPNDGDTLLTQLMETKVGDGLVTN